MIINIVLLCAFLVSVFMISVAMWAMYQFNIFRMSGFVVNPDPIKQKRIVRAQDFVTSHGGADRVRSAVSTGFEVFSPIAIVSLIVLCIRLVFFLG